MRKIWLMSVLMVMGGVLLAQTACAGAEIAEPTKVEPAKVEAAGIPTISTSVSIVTLMPTFAVTNPNDKQITITDLSYVLYLGEERVGLGEIVDSVYIPAKTKVNIPTVTTLTWAALWLRQVFEEIKQPPEAMMIALPSWKVVEGGLPMEALKEAWEGLPGGPATYKAEGTTSMFCDGKWLELPFSLTFQK